MGLDMLQSRHLFLECTASTIVRKRMGFGLRSDVAVAAVTMMARVGRDRKSVEVTSQLGSTEASCKFSGRNRRRRTSVVVARV